MLYESLEHFFVTCHFTTLLWKELIAWCNGRQIKVESLSAVNIIFGDWQRKDCFLLNHIILMAKWYIYNVCVCVCVCAYGWLCVRVHQVGGTLGGLICILFVIAVFFLSVIAVTPIQKC